MDVLLEQGADRVGDRLAGAGIRDAREVEGHVDHICRQTMALQRELQRLQPASQPAATGILPRLSDFPKLWAELEPIEQNGLLRAVFTDLFFDAHGQLRFIAANSPFSQLLGLPEEGLLIESH